MLPLFLSSCLSVLRPDAYSASQGSFLLSHSTFKHLDPIRIIEIATDVSTDYSAANLTIIDSDFISCNDISADHNGGAIDVANSYVTIVDSAFDSCMAHAGGAAIFSESTVFMFHTNFTLNSAVDEAGALYFLGGNVSITGGFLFANDSPNVGACSFNWAAANVTNVVFLLNRAHESEAGGVMVQRVAVNFEGGAFIHNHAEGGWAGALTIYDIIGNISFVHVNFVSNEVVDWRDTHVYVRGPNTTAIFAGCTFNNPDRKEAMIVEVVDDRAPRLIVDEFTLFGVKVPYVYDDMMVNESGEFTIKFGTVWSGGFALVMIVVGPVFMAIVGSILTC